MTLLFLVVFIAASIAIVWAYRHFANDVLGQGDQLYRTIKGAPPVASWTQLWTLLVVAGSQVVMFLLFDSRALNRPHLGSDLKPVAILVGVLGIITAYGIHVRARARWIRAATESDGALCLHCGYSLRGLPDHQNCPECGRPYDLEKVRARWRNWLGR